MEMPEEQTFVVVGTEKVLRQDFAGTQPSPEERIQAEVLVQLLVNTPELEV